MQEVQISHYGLGLPTCLSKQNFSLQQARTELPKAEATQCKCANQRRRQAEFQPGDYVWLEVPH